MRRHLRSFRRVQTSGLSFATHYKIISVFNPQELGDLRIADFFD